MEGSNNITPDNNQFKLSPKEKVLEVLAVGICFLLLLACFLKVMFF